MMLVNAPPSGARVILDPAAIVAEQSIEAARPDDQRAADHHRALQPGTNMLFDMGDLGSADQFAPRNCPCARHTSPRDAEARISGLVDRVVPHNGSGAAQQAQQRPP